MKTYVHEQNELGALEVLLWVAISTKAQDKYSIEDQLKLGRDWCARNDASIVDELVVRGFSRDYWTLADVVAASADDPDMEAFAQLQNHIRRRSFNLFLCFDADRFGRTTSLVHEVIGRVTRDCGARIYTLFDGIWIDAENAPMIGTLKALKAQQDVDRLKGYRATGMRNRAENGKSTSSEMPLYHRRVRDEKGKEIGIVVNEDLRPLWTNLAALILRGVSWNQLERMLFEEFGHGTGGKPYRVGYLHDLVLSPGFWGHAAVNYRQHHNRSTKGVAPWIWDETVLPPVDVTVFRNRLPAVYGGEWSPLGDQVKAELYRRYQLRGKATAGNTFRFHGLLICDVCGYTLTMTVGNPPKRQRYVRCATFYDHRYGSRGVACDQRGYMTIEAIQDYFHQQLERQLQGLPTTLFDTLQDTDMLARRAADHERQLLRLRSRVDALVGELADSPENVRGVFRRQIADASTEIERVNRELDTLRGNLHSSHDVHRAQRELIELLRANGGVEWLWRQSDTFIHQCLSAALGNNQLVVRDRQIIGVIPTRNPTLAKRRRRALPVPD